MYKLHLDQELAKDIFGNASKEILDWVVNAIANIVVADGIIEKHEFVALQEAIGLLENKEEINALMDRVKKKEIIEPTNFSFKWRRSPSRQINWNKTNEYYPKIGKRLPSEMEWGKAARGGPNTNHFGV